MKKRIVKQAAIMASCVLLLFLVLAFGACRRSDGVSVRSQADGTYDGLPNVRWRLSNSQAPDHLYQIAYEHFAAYVEEKSGGRFTIDVFHSGTLGTEQQVIENMQTGTIAGTLGAASLVANFVPGFNLFALPALFRDSDSLRSVMDDENVIRRLNEACEAAGIYNYGYFQTYFRQLYSRRPIRTLADLRGQRIRVMGAPVIVNTFQALGANPTTTAWAELYSALQLGVSEGMDHVAASVQAMAFFEHLNYVCEPNLFVTPMFILFSKPLYDRLPMSYQQLIDEAVANVLLPELRLGGDKANAEALAFLLRDGGLTYNHVDIQSMHAVVAPVRDRFIGQLEPWAQEVARRILDSN
jgi:TRAP-type C4-dicarboxylate transport system substrate-binding protein